MKNFNKKNKKILLDSLYNKFVALHSQYHNNIRLSNIFQDRLLNKYYTYVVYKNINMMIKWFVKHYDLEKYKCRIDVNGNRQYYLLVSDYCQNEFVCYKWYKEKMYNSYYDTKIYQDYLRNKGISNVEDYYIVDVPNYNF